MREGMSKFRGKRIDDGEWVYGFFISYDKLSYIFNDHIADAVGESDSLNESEVDPETVGEYIGIPDKNGKEIYEGDRCKYSNSEGEHGIGKIEYWEGSFVVCWESLNKPGIVTSLYYLGCGEEWEVVGNIHEKEKP